MRRLVLFAVLLLLVPAALAQKVPAPVDPAVPDILPMRERAHLIDDLLQERYETVLPQIMRRAGVDMWIVAAREYNEGPVIKTLLPATWIAARRRTILVFHDTGSEVERLAVARYAVSDSRGREVFAGAWEPETQPDQWARLAEVVAERDPSRIAIGRSSLYAFGDGLSATEYEAMTEALPQTYRDRLTEGHEVGVGWLETRTERERTLYHHVVRIARSIIAEGLSERVITPGVTTTEDVQWYYRDRIRALGLLAWFHPSVSVQRPGGGRDGDFSAREGASVIVPGDLLHVDFGITYLRLNTDTQQHAYVLRPGETEAPEGLRRALATGNRLQDVLTDEFAAGRSGNDILLAALAQAEREGIDATIYTHPIGYHGHGAGPTIGLWDQQGGVPGRGDYPLYPNTAHSIELNARVAIPEWGGQQIRVMLEEDAYFDGERVVYLDGRAEELLLIPRR
jgi:Xaa-Pro aminopeptidase